MVNPSGCQPKNNGTPKMDGENNGKPYEEMDDLGSNPLFLETAIIWYYGYNPSYPFIFGHLNRVITPFITGSGAHLVRIIVQTRPKHFEIPAGSKGNYKF